MQETIKQQVTDVLDKKGVLSRLKAELRANVFLAINEQDIKQGGLGLCSKTDSSNRQQLLDDPTGSLLVDLVWDFLDWCNLQLTLQVFEPELPLSAARPNNEELLQLLGLPDDDGDAPLLLQLLRQHIYSMQLQQQIAAPAATAAAASTSRKQQQQLSTSPGPAAASADKQQAAFASSPTQDTDTNGASLQAEDEDYDAVFLAAQSREGLKTDDSDISSSSSDNTREQLRRPTRNWLEALPQASADAAHKAQVANSSAARDEHQKTSPRHSKERQLVEQVNRQQQQKSTQGLTRDAATASSLIGSQAAAPADEALDDADQASLEVLHSPASAVTATGGGGSSSSSPATDKRPHVTSSSPLRSGRLAPIAPLAQGRGSLSTAAQLSSEGLKDELRRAGLLNSNNGNSDDMYVAQHTGAISRKHNGGQAAAVATSAVTATQLQHSIAEGESEDADPSVLGAVAAAGAAHGPVAVDPAYEDSDSDDFGLVEQQHLFEAARRRLSQQATATQQHAEEEEEEEDEDDDDDPALLLGQAQQELEQQLRREQHDDIAAHAGPAGQIQAALSGGDGAGGTAASLLTRSLDDIDFTGEDISEDISLPLEGLDDEDYLGMYEAAQPRYAQPAAAGASDQPDTLWSGLDGTGLSAADEHRNLRSADLAVDADDF